MEIIKGKSLDTVHRNKIYKGCVFYLNNNNLYKFVDSHFDNCSFRGEFFIEVLEDCKFNNCSASNSIVYMPCRGEREHKAMNESIFEFNCITDITIIDSPITNIPDEISNLKKLHCLLIKNGELEEINKEVYKLHNLKFLSFISNNIRELSKEICNLKNLEVISLSDNRIVDIPEEILSLGKLKVVSFYRNNLSKKSRDILDEFSSRSDKGD